MFVYKEFQLLMEGKNLDIVFETHRRERNLKTGTQNEPSDSIEGGSHLYGVTISFSRTVTDGVS
jgi:hypothetical protein